MLHDDFRTQVVIAVLAVAAAFMGWPKANAVEKPKMATLVEAANIKAPKKSPKKKGTAKVEVNLVKPIVPDQTWKPQTFEKVAEVKRLLSPVKLVLAKARAQLGKPYRYGAMGPSSFDCSGFTKFVWAAAGVALPHSSGGQYASLPKVPLDKMQPGDLIYSPGHIGMYIGDGKMIHSPRSGKVVEIAPLHSRRVGAVRPGL